MCVTIIVANSGDNEEITVDDIAVNDNDKLKDLKMKIEDVPFPTCEATTSTWDGVLRHWSEVFKTNAESLTAVQGVIDPKITVFTQIISAELLRQVFACLPQFVSPDQEENFDDYVPLEADGDTNKEHEVDNDTVVTIVDKVKKLMSKMKEIFKKNYDAWEQKDSFILLCTVPGLLSAVILGLQICMKKGVKRYSRELQERTRN